MVIQCYACALTEATQLVPGIFRAHALLLDICSQMPENLPQVLSALAMNLSSKDELTLRETFGIRELTQPQSHAEACCGLSGRNSEM